MTQWVILSYFISNQTHIYMSRLHLKQSSNPTSIMLPNHVLHKSTTLFPNHYFHRSLLHLNGSNLYPLLMVILWLFCGDIFNTLLIPTLLCVFVHLYSTSIMSSIHLFWECRLNFLNPSSYGRFIILGINFVIFLCTCSDELSIFWRVEQRLPVASCMEITPYY